MKTVINGLTIDAVFTDKDIRGIFLPLLEKLYSLKKEKRRRILVMLSGPPGCGKSTLAWFLSYLSENRFPEKAPAAMTEEESITAAGKDPGAMTEEEPLTVIGMDGFHYYQEYLLSHHTCRKGRRIPLAQVKGAPETFDLEKLLERIKEAADGREFRWPVYDRQKHDPAEDAMTVTGDIVLLEGNYLLLDKPGWTELSRYADYTIRISAEEAFLRERLTKRHLAGGKERAAAEAFVEDSDLYNAREVLAYSKPADLNLQVGYEGYTILEN